VSFAEIWDVILAIKIGFRNPGRSRPFAAAFLIAATFSLCSTLSSTDFLVDYRLGEKIIPEEIELIRNGPYLLQIVKQRASSTYEFVASDGTESYKEKFFNRDVNIVEIAKAAQGKPEFYLWIYRGNPIRKVWKVDFKSATILSFDRANFIYHLEADPTDGLIISALSYLTALMLIFKIKCDQ
jgi:hypothetical protein